MFSIALSINVGFIIWWFSPECTNPHSSDAPQWTPPLQSPCWLPAIIKSNRSFRSPDDNVPRPSRHLRYWFSDSFCSLDGADPIIPWLPSSTCLRRWSWCASAFPSAIHRTDETGAVERSAQARPASPSSIASESSSVASSAASPASSGGTLFGSTSACGACAAP